MSVIKGSGGLRGTVQPGQFSSIRRSAQANGVLYRHVDADAEWGQVAHIGVALIGGGIAPYSRREGREADGGQDCTMPYASWIRSISAGSAFERIAACSSAK